MQRYRIEPKDYPKNANESWWIVHPNRSGVEFRVPNGGMTVCLKDFLIFREGLAYNIISTDNHNGWVTIEGGGNLYDMPQYLFARHFDAESFVVGIASPVELENARPFDYRPTVPKRPSQKHLEQLKLFKG